MKHFLLIIFSFFTLSIFSQAAAPTPKIKISKGKFTKAKTIKEILPAFPKECPITEYRFAVETPQIKKSILVKNGKVSSDLKSIVKSLKPGQKFFIENLKSNCKKTFKTKHIFIIS